MTSFQSPPSAAFAFISHAHDDKDVHFFERLHWRDRMREAGIHYFMSGIHADGNRELSRNEATIPLNSNYEAELHFALKSQSCMVICWSRALIDRVKDQGDDDRGAWLQIEYEKVLEEISYGRAIQVFLEQNLKLNAIPLGKMLMKIEGINLSDDRHIAKNMSRLIEEMSKRLKIPREAPENAEVAKKCVRLAGRNHQERVLTRRFRSAPVQVVIGTRDEMLHLFNERVAEFTAPLYLSGSSPSAQVGYDDAVVRLMKKEIDWLESWHIQNLTWPQPPRSKWWEGGDEDTLFEDIVDEIRHKLLEVERPFNEVPRALARDSIRHLGVFHITWRQWSRSHTLRVLLRLAGDLPKINADLKVMINVELPVQKLLAAMSRRVRQVRMLCKQQRAGKAEMSNQLGLVALPEVGHLTEPEVGEFLNLLRRAHGFEESGALPQILGRRRLPRPMKYVYPRLERVVRSSLANWQDQGRGSKS